MLSDANAFTHYLEYWTIRYSEIRKYVNDQKASDYDRKALTGTNLGGKTVG